MKYSATAFFLIFIGCFSLLMAQPQSDPLPNFVLLMGDDHGWEETGYNGHPFLKTPILDEMAAKGLRLDRFYSASPVCSPTRGSVITGRHPNRYGTFTPNWSIRPEEISIAQLLKKAGYATAHFGKWHLGPVKTASPTNPGAMGFEEWLSHDNFFEMNPPLSRNGAAPEIFEGESSEILVAEAMKFIRKAQQSGKPFFVVIWFGSPHEPYSGTPKDLALYESLPERYSLDSVRLTSMKTGKATKRSLKEVLQERYAEITAMDRAIGQLRLSLKQASLQENTLLWYCGDNGIPASGMRESMFRAQKGKVYEGGIRVPGILEWPKAISAPGNSSIPTVTSDILPTLCELANVELPKRNLDGISLRSLIQGKMTQRPLPIQFWNYETRHEVSGNPKPYIPLHLQEGTTPLVKQMAGKYTRSFRNFHHPKSARKIMQVQEPS